MFLDCIREKRFLDLHLLLSCFRLDFHLVQLFFVCMPSLGPFHDKNHILFATLFCFRMPNGNIGFSYHFILCLLFYEAVYLVAQYARRGIKRMEAVSLL
jgi:hypothetical protein